MCGIYGAINLTKKFDPSIIKGLTWANRQRGTDSVGFFDSSGRMIKRAGDPADALSDSKIQRWLDNSSKYSWCIGGHTRFATRGGKTKRNAHPFRYGDIVGSHNGIVDAAWEYEVDSELIFDMLNKEGIKGLDLISGYWGLCWMDRSSNKFYLTAHNNTLAYAMYKGVCYFSSDGDHLSGFVDTEIHGIVEGQVLEFDADGNVKDSEQGDLPSVEGLERVYVDYSYNTGTVAAENRGGCSSSREYAGNLLPAGTTSRARRGNWNGDEYVDGSVGLPMPDDTLLYEDWTEYLNQSIHAMDDGSFDNWEKGQ